VPKSAFLSEKLTPDERKSKIVQEIQRLHGQEEPLNIPAVKRRHPELLKAVYEIDPFWGWKRALEAAGVDYSKIRTQLQDYITCQICGRDFANLGSHLAGVHETNKDDYLLDYPGSDLMSEEMRARKFLGKNDIVRHWERCWTPEYVLDRLAEFHRRGLPLNTAWLYEHDPQILCKARKCFENIRTALSAIGIDPQKVRVSRRKYPDAKAVLAGIRRRASAQLPLTTNEVMFGEHRDSSLLKYARKHFGCWTAALKAVGIDLVAHRQKLLRGKMRYPSPDSVIAEIRRRVSANLSVMCSRLFRGGPSLKDVSLVSSGYYYFGTWTAALKAAGVDTAKIRLEHLVHMRKRYPDADAVIAELKRRHAAQLPPPKSKQNNNKHLDQPLYNSARKFFGSLDVALKAAGFDPVKIRQERHRKRFRYPDKKAVIAEIQRRAKVLPHAAVSKGKHRDQALLGSARKFFGAWHAALKASGAGS
jgi:hypothetical protein